MFKRYSNWFLMPKFQDLAMFCAVMSLIAKRLRHNFRFRDAEDV
jgi:hypothetical protein